jgi:hypothetical protein
MQRLASAALCVPADCQPNHPATSEPYLYVAVQCMRWTMRLTQSKV